MSRHYFAGTPADWVFSRSGNSPVLVPGSAVNFYSAKTAGTHYTDLLDKNGSAATQVTAESDGSIAEFRGPDGVTEMWADAGGTRVKLVATDASATYAQVISVTGFGATGDGSTDDTAAIQAALDSGGTYAAVTADGVVVYFPPGRYKITSTLSLDAKHGVSVRGAGKQATEIFTTATTAVFSGVGTLADPLNKLTIEDMTITAGGNTNANAHGITLTYTNNCKVRDVLIFSAKRGMNIAHAWQLTLDTVVVSGGGSQASYCGFYMAESDGSDVNNAVVAINCTAQGVTQWGFRIINGQGSKFVSCEAMDGVVGWYIGDPTTGTQNCEWMNFSNCLADTNSDNGWIIKQGSGSVAVRSLQLSNCWAGNAGNHGFYLSGVTQSVFTGIQSVGNGKSGFYMLGSSLISLVGAQLRENNTGNSGTVGDIALENTTYSVISGVVSNSSHTAGKSVLESGTSNSNHIVGNLIFQGATISGANTRIAHNQGFLTETSGTDTATNGSTTWTVTHNLGLTPLFGDINAKVRGNVACWVTAATSTTFTVTFPAALVGAFYLDWSVRVTRQ